MNDGEIRKEIDRLAVRVAALELTLVPLLIAQLSRPLPGESLESRLTDVQAMRHRAQRDLHSRDDEDAAMIALISVGIDGLFDRLAMSIDDSFLPDEH